MDKQSKLLKVKACYRLATSPIWTNIDPDVCHHMASLDHNDLNFVLSVKRLVFPGFTRCIRTHIRQGCFTVIRLILLLSQMTLKDMGKSAFSRPEWNITRHKHYTYHKISNKSRTKSQNLNNSRLVLQLSLPYPLKSGVKSRIKM